MSPRLPPALTFLQETVELWSSRYAFQHAGALAFYTLFSMAPLALILIAIVGAVFGPEAARGEISDQIGGLIGRQAADVVEEAVRRSWLEEAGPLPTIIGGGVLLFGATTVFAQMQASLNQFWGVTAKPSRSGILVFLMTRLLSLSLVLIIGFILLTSLVITMTITAVLRFAEHWIPVPSIVVAGMDVAASLFIATVLFAMIFKVLPDVQLQWRHVGQAALVTALLFVAGQYLISLYLTHTAPASTFGAAGSLVMLLFWVYYSALILFFGVALTRVSLERSGVPIMPKSTAVRVRMDLLEEGEDHRWRKTKELAS